MYTDSNNTDSNNTDYYHVLFQASYEDTDKANKVNNAYNYNYNAYHYNDKVIIITRIMTDTYKANKVMRLY